MRPQKYLPLNWVQWTSLLTSMAVAVLFPLFVIQGRAQRAQANEGLRTFICFFEAAALHPQGKPAPTGGQKLFIEHFFTKTLVAIHEQPCTSP
jgi:hypothetical protein